MKYNKSLEARIEELENQLLPNKRKIFIEIDVIESYDSQNYYITKKIVQESGKPPRYVFYDNVKVIPRENNKCFH